jgi:hypothetical protein
MCTILLVVPLSFSLLFAVSTPTSTSKSPAKKNKLLLPRPLLYILPTLLYLFLFYHIPLPVALQSSNRDTDAMTAALARLVVVGTVEPANPYVHPLLHLLPTPH